jgi:hypothetical protein
MAITQRKGVGGVNNILGNYLPLKRIKGGSLFSFHKKKQNVHFKENVKFMTSGNVGIFYIRKWNDVQYCMTYTYLHDLCLKVANLICSFLERFCKKEFCVLQVPDF